VIITLQDGNSIEIGPREECKVAFGEIVIYPSGPVPCHLSHVWDDPPTYAKLLPLRAERVAKGDYMLSERGLSQVTQVAY
jgi:hypothetical protein